MVESAEPVPVNTSTPVYVKTNGYGKFQDAELIARCLNGEEPAWAALLERYGSFIYSIAVKFNLPPDDVSYVFQIVFHTLLENLEALQEEPRLSAWLATVTLWQCRQLVEPDHSEGEAPEHSDSILMLYQDIQQLERERLIRQAVSMLEEPTRQCLVSLVAEFSSDDATNDASDFQVPAIATGLS